MKNLMFRLANTLTGMGTGLMASSEEDFGTGNDAVKEAYTAFKGAVNTVLWIILAVLLAVGIFYGISMGIKFAKAEDADARDKVKQQLINLAIGVGVAAVIIIVCSVLVSNDVFANLDIFKSNSGS